MFSTRESLTRRVAEGTCHVETIETLNHLLLEDRVQRFTKDKVQAENGLLILQSFSA